MKIIGHTTAAADRTVMGKYGYNVIIASTIGNSAVLNYLNAVLIVADCYVQAYQANAEPTAVMPSNATARWQVRAWRNGNVISRMSILQLVYGTTKPC